eukprot:4821687-Ditylum_brightwellii.AAC.1
MWKECQGDKRENITDMVSANKKRFEQEIEAYQKSVDAKESKEKTRTLPKRAHVIQVTTRAEIK